MIFLQNNRWPADTVFRVFLTIVFIFWLATVMSQYDDNKTEKKQEEIDNSSNKNIVIEQLKLPPVPTPKTKQQEVAAAPATRSIKAVKQTPAVNKQQVEQVYQKLNEQGVDIQIAWPQSVHQQQAALHFMYQCAGMQFAVLNGQNITKVNQISLSDYSDWIRVAQGNLSKKEQHWLKAYALSGTPIRLFPKEIDLRLAQRLANELQGAPLVNLRASYQVNNQRLLLANIQLNQQSITGNWELFQGRCD